MERWKTRDRDGLSGCRGVTYVGFKSCQYRGELSLVTSMTALANLDNIVKWHEVSYVYVLDSIFEYLVCL